MASRFQLRVISLLAVALAPAAWAQAPIEFRGTIGQQAVRLTVQVEGDAIAAAHYRYESQKDDVPLPEGRFFGSTIILADADGNVFHLHLKGKDGSGTSDLAAATALSGLMDRDDLELPVEVTRVTK